MRSCLLHLLLWYSSSLPGTTFSGFPESCILGSSMKRIAILGSTGSIGRSTLSIVESYPDKFQVVTMAAGTNLDLALEQACRWRPKILSVANEKDADALRTQL